MNTHDLPGISGSGRRSATGRAGWRRGTLPAATGLTLLAGLTAVALVPQTSRAELSLYLSAPGVQRAEDSGFSNDGHDFLTETFDSLPNGTLNQGQLSFGGSSTAANGGVYTVSGTVTSITTQPWGGYNQGRYLSVNGPGSTVTIDFDQGINYFGFLWTAGDVTNVLTFYDESGNQLGRYTTDHLVDLLNRDTTTTITAINGEDYFTGYYYGQPSATWPVQPLDSPPQIPPPALNNTEPYGYLHFITSGATPPIFNIVIEKGPGGTGNFENDNHTVSVIAPVVDNTPIVDFGEIPMSEPVPEPSSFAVVAGAASALLLRRRRA